MKLTLARPVIFSAVTLAGIFAQAIGQSLPVPSVSTPIEVANPVSAAPPAAGVPVATTFAPQGETAVQLDVGFGIRAVPPARITIPYGDRLRLVAPRISEGVNYIWTKDGRALPGAPDSNVLVIDYLISSDVGTYACLFSTPTTQPAPSQTLILGVGPTNRLLNLSTRGIVGTAPDQALTTGFVVGGATAKKMILRAVGPSLAAFGVATPLRQPVLRIFDANGRLYLNAYVYPAVVGGLTYESDLAESLAKTGAFPLPTGSRDVTEMRPFEPGSYTATVTSGDGASGTVLLELYEVP